MVSFTTPDVASSGRLRKDPRKRGVSAGRRAFLFDRTEQLLAVHPDGTRTEDLHAQA